MPADKNIPGSRRSFLRNGIKLATLSGLLFPLQKVFGKSSSFIINNGKKVGDFIRKPGLHNELILNTKTKIVHLPTDKIFADYSEISVRHKRILDLKTWEAEVKSPTHFIKDKSAIVIELLALQKLNIGINDRTLTAAIGTLSIAFTPTYKNKNGKMMNKYRFRLHYLLLQTIALNNTIPAAQKWTKFQAATGNINYTTRDLKSLPKRMTWIKTKTEFDKQVAYILQNKMTYMNRLKDRAALYKL